MLRNGSPFLFAHQEQVCEEQELETLLADLPSPGDLVRSFPPTYPGAGDLLDQPPARVDKVEPGHIFEFKAGVDLDKLILPLSVSGTLIAFSHQIVKHFQTFFKHYSLTEQ